MIVYFKMEKIHISIFLIICAGSLLLAQEDTRYCYKFRWVAPIFNDRPEKYNCTMIKHAPCVSPLLNTTENPPDPRAVWNSEGDSVLCSLTSSEVCIKYTFTYNNAVVNVSRYCGKIIEDEISPVTTGCYQQSVDGYILETCACQSQRGGEPCNASTQIKYSIILFIISLLVINFAY